MDAPDARRDAAPADEELLRRAAARDEGAFTELVRRHEDRVFGIAVRMTRDRADALDATQDTFVAVYRQAGTFRGDAAFTTWLYRVAVNATRDLLRKRRRAPEPVDEVPERGVPSGEAGNPEDTVSLRLDLARALAELPDEYREAVLMHDLGAIPYEEIAKITGAALGTVKSRISRGRRRLAALMEQPAGTGTSKGEDG
ncbi:MAG: RNA polymerase sigma factor [Actinomycetota bacterium]